MPRPPLKHILKNDYPSLLFLIFIGVIWVAVAFGGIFGYLPRRAGPGKTPMPGEILPLMAAGAALLSILFGWLAWRRVGMVRRVVTTGAGVEGTIVWIWFEKDRGRVEYEYEIDGKPYRAGNAIWKNNETKHLKEGDPVTLLVDPLKPSRAFIEALYR